MKYVTRPDPAAHRHRFRTRPLTTLTAALVWLALIASTALIREADAHGRLMDPPARNSMWRLGFNNPVNYNDNELYCGGRMVQWLRNGGKCGVCGDAYHGQREHEAGGKFANGIITRTYKEGGVIPITVHLTANHQGWFEVRVCPVNGVKKAVTQECLDKHVLRRTDGAGVQYHVPKGKYNAFFNYTLQLPTGLTCSQCVVQWKYRTGNTWDKDDNSGVFCLGCGPQEEFYNCADIEILPDKAKKFKSGIKSHSKEMLNQQETNAKDQQANKHTDTAKEAKKADKDKEDGTSNVIVTKPNGESDEKKKGHGAKSTKGGANGKKEKLGADLKRGGAEGKGADQTLTAKRGVAEAKGADHTLTAKKGGAVEEMDGQIRRKGGANENWPEQRVEVKKGGAPGEDGQMGEAVYGSSKPREASYSWHAASPLSWAISPRRYVPRHSVTTTSAAVAAASTAPNTRGSAWWRHPLNPFTPPPGATRRSRPSTTYSSGKSIVHPRTALARETTEATRLNVPRHRAGLSADAGRPSSKRPTAPTPPPVTPAARPSSVRTERTINAVTATAPTPASSSTRRAVRNPFTRPHPTSATTPPAKTTARIRGSSPAGANNARRYGVSSSRDGDRSNARDSRDSPRPSGSRSTDQRAGGSIARDESSGARHSGSSTSRAGTRRHGRMPKWLVVRVAEAKDRKQSRTAPSTTAAPEIRAETFSMEARRQLFRQKLWRHLQRIKQHSGGDTAEPERIVQNKAKSDKTRPRSTVKNKASSERTAKNEARSERTTNNKARSERTTRIKARSERTTNNEARSERTTNNKARSERTTNNKAGSERTTNNKAGSERTTNNKAGSERTTNNEARSERTTNNKARSERTTNNKARSERTTDNKARSERTTHIKARSDRTTKNKERSDVSTLNRSRPNPLRSDILTPKNKARNKASPDTTGSGIPRSGSSRKAADRSDTPRSGNKTPDAARPRMARSGSTAQDTSKSDLPKLHSAAQSLPSTKVTPTCFTSSDRAGDDGQTSGFRGQPGRSNIQAYRVQQPDTRRRFAYSSRSQRGHARGGVFTRDGDLSYRSDVEGGVDGDAGGRDVFHPMLQRLSGRSDRILPQLQPLPVDGDGTLIGSGDGLWWGGYRDLVWAPVPAPPIPRLRSTPTLLRSAPAGPAPVVSKSTLQCRAIVRLGGGMDDWCTANCNANYCPTDMCVCQRLTQPLPQLQRRVQRQETAPPFSGQSPVRYRLVREDKPQRGASVSSWIMPYKTRVPFGLASNGLTLRGSGSGDGGNAHLRRDDSNDISNPLPTTDSVYGPAEEAVTARPFLVTYAPFAVQRQSGQRSRGRPEEVQEKAKEEEQKKEEEEKRVVVGGASGWGQSQDPLAAATVLCRAVGRYAGLAHYDKWCSNNCAQAMCPLFMCACDTF